MKTVHPFCLDRRDPEAKPGSLGLRFQAVSVPEHAGSFPFLLRMVALGEGCVASSPGRHPCRIRAQEGSGLIPKPIIDPGGPPRRLCCFWLSSGRWVCTFGSSRDVLLCRRLKKEVKRRRWTSCWRGTRSSASTTSISRASDRRRFAW